MAGSIESPRPAFGGAGQRSLAQIELINGFFVFFGICLLEVIQMTAALADQYQKPAAGVEILLVGLEMLIEQIDLFGQNRDLHRG